MHIFKYLKPLKQIYANCLLNSRALCHHFTYSNWSDEGRSELQYITDSLYDFHRSVTYKEKNQCDKAAQGMSDTNINAV